MVIHKTLKGNNMNLIKKKHLGKTDVFAVCSRKFDRRNAQRI